MSQQTIEQPVQTTSPRKATPRRKTLPQWHVVLIDDDAHTYAYVIEMLGRVFGHAATRATHMAREVDTRGRVIVFTGHRELAELKRDQVVTFGTDHRVSSCSGGMTAVLQQAG